MERIYLSPPNLSEDALTEISKVLETGWIAPVGPAIDQFESKLEAYYRGKRVLVLNSGTSALHLALILAGVGDGDEVLVSSFTFAACANVVLYERAVPVFLDSESGSWNLDPGLLEDYLSNSKKLPKAVIVTHLYGMPADITRIVEVARKYDIQVIEDAAESLGSTFDGEPVGCFGDFGILSFNGNKIITTSAGGALICDPDDWERAKHLATQANSGAFGYDHKEAGYNYRMSNVLAGIGISQLAQLESFVQRKRSIFQTYRRELSDYLNFNSEPMTSFSNRWLTTALLKDEAKSVENFIKYFNDHLIETRRLWKPLHMHDAYSGSPFIGDQTCEKIFEKGICLPSGSGLTEEEQNYVITRAKEWLSQ